MEVSSLGFAIVVAWAIAAVVLVVFGIVWLAQKRTKPGLALVASGILMIAVPAGIGVWWTTWGGRQHSAWVEGLNPETDPGLTVHITHDRDFQDGLEYTFGNAGDVDHVVAVFQEQHPNGVVTMDSGDDSVWHMSDDDIRYDLFYDTEMDWFSLESQQAVVTPADETQPQVRIPFPRAQLGPWLTEVTNWTNEWTEDQWHAFYDDISEVTFGEDTITVPTNRGGTVTLTFDATADTYTVTIND